MEVSSQLHTLATLPQGDGLWCPSGRVGLDAEVKRKVLAPAMNQALVIQTHSISSQPSQYNCQIHDKLQTFIVSFLPSVTS
jgi:hypothetical protein